MKKRLTLAAALAATIVMTGCMSERRRGRIHVVPVRNLNQNRGTANEGHKRRRARCTTLSAYDAIAYSEYGISTIGTQQDTRHEVQQTS